tara:strand:+ start:186 stop:440 length:255 start_codon:yes stop_codon:yes gene_type:complete
MNNVTIFIYLVFLCGVAGATFAYMWKLMTMTLDDFSKMDRPTKTQRSDLHPEMQDVKSGEQLLVFNPNPNEEDDGEGDVFIVRK